MFCSNFLIELKTIISIQRTPLLHEQRFDAFAQKADRQSKIYSCCLRSGSVEVGR